MMVQAVLGRLLIADYPRDFVDGAGPAGVKFIAFVCRRNNIDAAIIFEIPHYFAESADFS
ncbi:MAG: hypothetical protein GYA36_17410 [Veillonellaceae bacterium]|nr:hypothetical protein [Veillonellaceae bacterium]